MYRYAEGDRVAERADYSYAPTPDGLLAAWRAARESVLARVGDGGADGGADTDAYTDAGADTETDANAGPDIGAASGAPARALSGPCSGADFVAQARGDARGSGGVALDRLLQRFEVSKRIHAAYDADLRAVRGSAYEDLALYLDAAEVFEMAWSRHARLPFLNGLLKILDSLSSRAGDLAPADAARLARLVRRERVHIDVLAERVHAVHVAGEAP